jgi:rubrerythrin
MLPIETVDVDGAIREAEEAVAGDTRADFFRKAALGGGALVGGGVFAGMLPEIAAAKPSKKQDIKILQYALTLEYLETAFYKEASASGALSGDAQALAVLIGDHEAAHVKAIKGVLRQLGAKPGKSPEFNFQGTNTDPAKFIPTALLLEQTGVYAYHGQVTRIKSKAILAAAAAIATVESRHAAAVAVLNANAPFADKTSTSITDQGAFDGGKSMNAILKAVGGTGFIVD